MFFVSKFKNNLMFSGPVYDVLQKCGVFNDQLLTLFPTIHDAVLFTRNNPSNQDTKF